MNPRRQQRLGAALAVVLLVGGAIGALLYAMQENVDLFYTPTQLVEGLGEDKTKPVVGQRLRIGGMVVVGSVKRDADSLKVSFDLRDTGPVVTVIYDGILPDLFREGQGIVAQGVLVNATTIEATEVLAKHDENYMPPEVAEAMKGIKHVPPRLQQADGKNGYGASGYGSSGYGSGGYGNASDAATPAASAVDAGDASATSPTTQGSKNGAVTENVATPATENSTHQETNKDTNNKDTNKGAP